jgi:hypothetical protein
LDLGKVLQAWLWDDAAHCASTVDGSRLFFKPSGEARYCAWDVGNNKPVDGYEQLVKYNRIVDFVPGDRQALVEDAGKDYLVDVADGKRVGPLPPRLGPMVAGGRGQLDCRIAVGGYADGTIRLVDRLTGKERAAFQFPDGEAPEKDSTIWLSPDARYACVATDHSVYLLRLPDPPPVKDKP